jgi:hypothetical protein
MQAEVQQSVVEQLVGEGEAKRRRRRDAEAGCVFALHAVVVVVVVVVVVARSSLLCGGAILRSCGSSQVTIVDLLIRYCTLHLYRLERRPPSSVPVPGWSPPAASQGHHGDGPAGAA